MTPLLLALLQTAAADPACMYIESLGVEAQSMSPRMQRIRGASGGVLIVDVHPYSPAARAGLAPGDVLVAVEHRTIRNPAQLEWRLSMFEGDEIALTTLRHHHLFTLETYLPHEDWWVADVEAYHHREIYHHREVFPRRRHSVEIRWSRHHEDDDDHDLHHEEELDSLHERIEELEEELEEHDDHWR